MLAVAASPSLGLVLRFDGLHVARPPGVVWQVYLSPPGLGPKARKPYRFGNIALFGAGVGAAPPAAVELRNDAVVLRALRAASDELELTFVPAGPLIDGKPTTPTPAAALRVAKLTLWSETL